jgi:hypothetical protein
MKALAWFLLVQATVAPLYAKPKVDVWIKVNEEKAKEHVSDKLGLGNPTATNTFRTTVFYLNVAVTSDNAEAVAKNNGQWCISGDTALHINGEYQGVLDGNDLDIQVPDKNGKPKKLHFEVYDHKWRKLPDIE